MTKIILLFITLFVISACMFDMPHHNRGFSGGHTGSAAQHGDDSSSSDSHS